MVVKDPKVKAKLATGKYCGFIVDSAFTIVGVSLPFDRDSEKWGVVDVTIALQNMVLAAEVQGVGSCWIGDFKEEDLREILNLPEKAKAVALISFGIPDEKPGPKTKKSKDEIFHADRW